MQQAHQDLWVGQVAVKQEAMSRSFSENNEPLGSQHYQQVQSVWDYRRQAQQWDPQFEPGGNQVNFTLFFL